MLTLKGADIILPIIDWFMSVLNDLSFVMDQKSRQVRISSNIVSIMELLPINFTRFKNKYIVKRKLRYLQFRQQLKMVFAEFVPKRRTK